MIRALFWRIAASVATIPAVTDRLIARARRRPYTPITSRDGYDVYMERFWLFNPYPNDGDKAGWEEWDRSWRRHLPSARIHHIRRADDDGHLHDHPWNARTIILRGYYTEVLQHPLGLGQVLRLNGRGDTNRLLFGEYHRISMVPPDGVWTLFITWRKRGTWGFLVNGVKVPWRTYLGIDKAPEVDQHPV